MLISFQGIFDFRRNSAEIEDSLKTKLRKWLLYFYISELFRVMRFNTLKVSMSVQINYKFVLL